jgi:hypothetical protein
VQVLEEKEEVLVEIVMHLKESIGCKFHSTYE